MKSFFNTGLAAACTAACHFALAGGVGDAPTLPRMAGSGAFLIVQPDGSLFIYGEREYLPHGNGTPRQPGHSPRPKPVPGVQGAVDAAGVSEHAVVALADGRVLGWGEPCAATGVIEDPLRTSPLLAPTPVPGAAGAVQVVAGERFSAARTADGGVIAWGELDTAMAAEEGRRNGCAAATRLPLANVVQLSAGRQHLLALRGDGTVWAAGRNTDGRLGTGSQQDSIGPMKVQGLSDVAQVAAMGLRSVALKRDGSLWQWGWELSDKPVRVPLQARAVAVQAHGGYAIAQLGDGTLWAWGEGYGGVFGNGSFDRVSAQPLKVPLKFRPVAWQALNHAVFAWTEDGTLVGWGAHGYTPPGSPRRGHSTVPEPLLKWTAPAQLESALRPWPGQAQPTGR